MKSLTIKSSKEIIAILIIGFLIRLLFWFFGAEKILSGELYSAGDTPGWTDSFLNLLNTGYYTFDPANPDAAFGRVPGYSFFWGLHYVIWGKHYVYQAVAVSQILLDCGTVYLLFRTSYTLFQDTKIALLTALIYATYPFSILWITVSYPEILTNFLCCSWLYLLLKRAKGIHYVLMGLLCAVIFFVREFAGITLVISLAVVWWEERHASSLSRYKKCLIILLSFLSLYSLWPIRNYINHDQLVFGRSYNGFAKYSNDYVAYRNWTLCWDSDETKWQKAVCSDADTISFPDNIFRSKEEKRQAEALTLKARNCGSSFLEWRIIYDKDFVYPSDVTYCNDTIAEGFQNLRSNYIRNFLFDFLTKMPLENLGKIVFKNSVYENSIVSQSFKTIYRLVFAWRSLLILSGLLGIMFYIRKKPMLLPIALFIAIIYFYFCMIARYVEIRNFLYSDTLLLLPATVFIVEAGRKIWPKK